MVDCTCGSQHEEYDDDQRPDERADEDRPPPRVTIMSLPPELLIMIFDYIHAPLRDARETIRDAYTASRDIQDLNERMTRGRSFPYTYAEVCAHWAAVVLSVPRFWTNAVVLIGPGSAPGKFIGGADAIFAASRKLPIDVTIRSTSYDKKQKFDRTYDYIEPEEMMAEHAALESTLKLLVPHLHRCRSLSLFTYLTDCGSLVYRTLEGQSPLLKMLTLQTDRPPYRCLDGVPINSSAISTSFSPALEQIIMDGYTFQSIHKYHEQIREKYALEVVSLAILNYGHSYMYPASPSEKLLASTAVSALQQMPLLDSLKLANIEFDLRDTAEPLVPLELDIRALTLEDMPLHSLHELFQVARFPELEEVWFKGCWPAHYEYEPGWLPTHCSMITLESVMHWGVCGDDLAKVLKLWDVNTIRSCASPAFDDTVLEMMSKPVDPEIAEADIDENTEFGCDALRAISIIATPAVTVAGLKNMVEKRNRWVDYTDAEWRNSAPAGPAIINLSLWEMPHSMMFTEEDVAWFEARVAHFKVESMMDVFIQYDTELYHL